MHAQTPRDDSANRKRRRVDESEVQTTEDLGTDFIEVRRRKQRPQQLDLKGVDSFSGAEPRPNRRTYLPWKKLKELH